MLNIILSGVDVASYKKYSIGVKVSSANANINLI